MIRISTLAKALALILLFAGSTVAVSACNTIAGVGEDISDSAKRVKRAL